ncbi:hypothetical protein JCM21900_002620 [Sporobolomyces salmonicolor]
MVAIPFVCTILEQQCAKSRVIRPPNPWLMPILRLLVELYQAASLKLNLEFDIEVLCKSPDIDIKAVEPTDLLRNRPTAKDLAAALMLGVNPPGYSLSRFTLVPFWRHRLGRSPEHPDPGRLQRPAPEDAQRPLFASNNALKRLVCVAIDRAICVSMAPVVERSVTIAGISTRELTTKGFAIEGDETEMGSPIPAAALPRSG